MTKKQLKELIFTIAEWYCNDAEEGFVSKKPESGTEVYDYLFSPSTTDGKTILQAACRELGYDVEEVLPYMVSIAMETQQAIVDYFNGLKEM